MPKPEGYWSSQVGWIVWSLAIAAFLFGLWWQGRLIAQI